MDKYDIELTKANYKPGTKVVLGVMEGEDPANMPSELNGVVESVDDVGQIHVKWENGSTLALNPEVDTFDIKIDVLYIQVGKKPEVRTITANLTEEQKLVGGYIEATYPFEDEIAIICNEEGKINGMLPNRMITSPEVGCIDVIFGNFFIVAAPSDSENYQSLNEELIAKYSKLFEYPELLYRNGSELGAYKYDPETYVIKDTDVNGNVIGDTSFVLSANMREIIEADEPEIDEDEDLDI